MLSSTPTTRNPAHGGQPSCSAIAVATAISRKASAEQQSGCGYAEAQRCGPRFSGLLADFNARKRNFFPQQRLQVGQNPADQSADCLVLSQFRIHMTGASKRDAALSSLGDWVAWVA